MVNNDILNFNTDLEISINYANEIENTKFTVSLYENYEKIAIKNFNYKHFTFKI